MRRAGGRAGGWGTDLGDGVLAGELAAELAADLGNKLAEDARVGAGKVDVLEYALRRAKLLRKTQRGEGAHLDRVGVDDDHLPWLHVAHVFRLAQVQRARLRRNAVAVGPARAALRQLADAQGPEPIRISHSNKRSIRQKNARKSLHRSQSHMHGSLDFEYISKTYPFRLGHSVKDLIEL